MVSGSVLHKFLQAFGEAQAKERGRVRMAAGEGELQGQISDAVRSEVPTYGFSGSKRRGCKRNGYELRFEKSRQIVLRFLQQRGIVFREKVLNDTDAFHFNFQFT